MTEEEVRAIMGAPQTVTVTESIDRHPKDSISRKDSIGHFWRYNGRTWGLSLTLSKSGILLQKTFVLPDGGGLDCRSP